jgi:hypothetical protein
MNVSDMATIVIYAHKSFLQVTLHVLEAFNPTDLHLTPTRSSGISHGSGYRSFRPFGTVSNSMLLLRT